MQPRLICLFVLIPLVLAPLATSAMNLLGYLPAETLLSAEIDDVGVLLENLEEGPLGELWNSKAVKKLRDRFVSEATAGDEMEEEIKELLERLKKWSEKLSGQTVIAYDTPLDLLKLRKDKADLDEDGDEVPDGPNISGLQILAEVKDASFSDLEEFVQWFEKTSNEIEDDKDKLRVEKTKLDGGEVFWIAPKESWEAEDGRFGLFLIDGILGFGSGVSTVEGLIDRIAGGSEEKSLAENTAYREAFDEIGKGDVRVFVNFPPFYKALLAMMTEAQKDLEDSVGNKNEETPGGLLGFSLQKMLTALGLDGLESFALQLDVDKRGLEMGFGIFVSKRKGLLQLLPKQAAPVSLVPLIPRNVSSASIMRFDIGLFWDTLLEILHEVNPNLTPLINLQLGMIEKKAGVSLRKDVLGSLGTEVFTFSEDISPLITDLKPKGDEEPDTESLDLELKMPEDFFAIALRDADRFDRSLRALLGALMPGVQLFKDQEHKGVVVRTMAGENASFAYAVTPKWLFLNLGEPARMLQTIARLDNPRKTLWGKPALSEALKDLPDDAQGVDYSDLEVFSGLLSVVMGKLFEELLGEELDEKDLPELPYFVLGWTRSLPNGMVGHAKLYRKIQDE